MAEKLGYMILAEEFTGVNKDKEALELVYAEVKRLSATPSPENLYLLAELISFTATQVIDQRLNWLESIADVKRGAEGDKPEWDVPYTGIVVEIGAKGSTPQVSKIYNKKVVVPTFQIAVRPKIDHQDFVQRPQLILRSVEEAAVRMENALVKHMQDAMLTTYTTLSSPNYVTGAGVDATTFGGQLTTIQRFGQASILGDIGMVTQLTALTGYSNRVANELMIEANNNRFLGTFKGANVVELTNRYADEFSLAESNLVLRKDLLFVVPTGSPEQRPLKVFLGGGIRTANRTNFEDESYEMIMRMDVGVAVIGNQLITAIYKDTNK
jgi:hypothetical protein